MFLTDRSSIVRGLLIRGDYALTLQVSRTYCGGSPASGALVVGSVPPSVTRLARVGVTRPAARLRPNWWSVPRASASAMTCSPCATFPRKPLGGSPLKSMLRSAAPTTHGPGNSLLGTTGKAGAKSCVSVIGTRKSGNPRSTSILPRFDVAHLSNGPMDGTAPPRRSQSERAQQRPVSRLSVATAILGGRKSCPRGRKSRQGFSAVERTRNRPYLNRGPPRRGVHDAPLHQRTSHAPVHSLKSPLEPYAWTLTTRGESGHSAPWSPGRGQCGRSQRRTVRRKSACTRVGLEPTSHAVGAYAPIHGAVARRWQATWRLEAGAAGGHAASISGPEPKSGTAVAT